MKHPVLADLSLADFTVALRRACQTVLRGQVPDLTAAAHRALHSHYCELRRWSPRLALIGAGTASEVLERHYAESLAVLPWIEALDLGSGLQLVDLGSGAGFPGWVLAAARHGIEATLVEARERKWSFLEAATRKARTGPAAVALPIHCLNARVGIPLPRGLPKRFDLVTCRALKLEPQVLADLARRMTPEGRFLLWLGAETPPLPAGLVRGRELSIGGSERRRILEFCRS